MKRTTSGSSLYERLCEALRDPETMRKAGTLLLAKMIGLAIVLTLMTKWYLPSEAWADAAPALPPRISTRSTPCGHWLPHTWCSACRSDS